MNQHDSAGPHGSASRLASVLLALVIIELTAATAYIHVNLGGPLFWLNGLGYLALATAYAVGVAATVSIIRRFSWLPRLGLAAYTPV